MKDIIDTQMLEGIKSSLRYELEELRELVDSQFNMYKIEKAIENLEEAIKWLDTL